MPIRTDEASAEITNPVTGDDATGLLGAARAERMKRARRSRGLSLAQLSNTLKGLGRGSSVASSTITNYETQTSRRTSPTVQNLDAIALVLQYDPRALTMAPPYDGDDHDRDLEDAALEPRLSGRYWPREDGVAEWREPGDDVARFEIYVHSRRLSMVLLRRPGSKGVDPADERVLVGGDEVEAYNYVLHRLRKEGEYLRSRGLDVDDEGMGHVIPMLDPEHEGQYRRLLLLAGRHELPDSMWL